MQNVENGVSMHLNGESKREKMTIFGYALFKEDCFVLLLCWVGKFSLKMQIACYLMCLFPLADKIGASSSRL